MHFSNSLALTGLLALVDAAPLTTPWTSRLASRSSLSGQATYYGGNVTGGACSFSTYTLPSGIYGTALSDSNWDDSAECGRCVSVTGPSGNSITAMIVDECPGCGTNHLDLFPDAFTALAPEVDGVIDVTWEYVSCDISTPLELHNKDGVSEYWFSMQVVNANQGVDSLEVSTDGGSTWESTTRQTYNFFEISSGTGTSTVDIKVTGVDGTTVIVDSVDISSGTSVTASSNFGSSSSGSTASSAASSSVVSSSAAVAKEEATSTSAISTAAPTTAAIVAETTSAAPVTIETPVASSTAVAAVAGVSSSAAHSSVAPASVAPSSAASSSVAPLAPAVYTTAASPVASSIISTASAVVASSSVSIPGLVGIQLPTTTIESISTPTAVAVTAAASTVTVYNCPTPFSQGRHLDHVRSLRG